MSGLKAGGWRPATGDWALVAGGWELMALHPAVIRDHRLIAEHDAVLDRRVPADVALAAENRPTDDRFLADAAVGPDDRVVDRRVLLDVALASDHGVRTDARARLDDRAF